MPYPATPEDRPRSIRRSVTVAILGVTMAQLPINAVSVSLTAIAADTGASISGLQWVQSIYILAMAAAVLSAGVIAENIGRRRVMVTALVLMAAGSLLGGLAALTGELAMPVLWAGQALSGLGGGAMLPTTLGTIAMAVPDPRRRGPYMALWGAGTTGGLAFGAIVGGLILEVAAWGWIFAPSFLAAVIIAVITRLTLPAAPTSRPGMDVPGQIFATLAVIGLLFGVIQGGAQGWLSAQAVTGYAAGVIFLGLFIHHERRTPAPLMDLRIFTNPGFAAAGIAAMMALFSVVGVGFLLAVFLGSVKSLTPLGIATYIVFLPGTAFIAAPLVARGLARLPAELSLGLGLLLAALGAFLIARTDEGSSQPDVVWRVMIFGVSVAIMFASVATVAVNAVPLRQAAMAGASNTVLRQIGGALGPAVAGSIYASRMAAGAAPAAAFGTALDTITVLLVLAAGLVAAAGLRGQGRGRVSVQSSK